MVRLDCPSPPNSVPLRMSGSITRRDFLNGVALSIGAGLTPRAAVAAAPLRYPPALTGMRGHHPGSFEVGHALAREGRSYAIKGMPIEEHYDLVVVGAGLSGLAAAYFYRRAAGPRARILVLDNHDDFGGHAKRNEFRLGDRLILGYGGSESLQSPKSLFGKVALGLLRELAVDLDRFEQAFERTLYPSLGLSRGVFFNREAFGRDVLVTGDPMRMVADDIPADRLNGKPVREFVAGFPVSEASKRQLIALYEGRDDPYPAAGAETRIRLLKQTSYRDFLMKTRAAARRSPTASRAARSISPRSAPMRCRPTRRWRRAIRDSAGSTGRAITPRWTSPTSITFPTATLRSRDCWCGRSFPTPRPGTAWTTWCSPGSTMARSIAPARRCASVSTAPASMSAMPARRRRPRLRAGEPPAPHPRRAGRARLLQHGHPVHHAGASAAQREALAQNVKAPLVYTKVLVRDWQPWVRLGVHEISGPMSFHCRVKLDYPVSLGGYRHPRDPSEPIGLHLVHVPGEPNPGLDAREQFRLGRAEAARHELRADSRRRSATSSTACWAPAASSAAATSRRSRSIAGRHGYSYFANSLFDGPDAKATIATARKRVGRVAIANSDARWSPYAHSAIDAAHDAVRELLAA